MDFQMVFSGKYDNESWVDYKKELKVFLKDCFDHHDSNGELDSDLIKKVEVALNIIIGFSEQYSIDQEAISFIANKLKKPIVTAFFSMNEFKEVYNKVEFEQLWEKLEKSKIEWVT